MIFPLFRRLICESTPESSTSPSDNESNMKEAPANVKYQYVAQNTVKIPVKKFVSGSFLQRPCMRDSLMYGLGCGMGALLLDLMVTPCSHVGRILRRTRTQSTLTSVDLGGHELGRLRLSRCLSESHRSERGATKTNSTNHDQYYTRCQVEIFFIWFNYCRLIREK